MHRELFILHMVEFLHGYTKCLSVEFYLACADRIFEVIVCSVPHSSKIQVMAFLTVILAKLITSLHQLRLSVLKVSQ